MAGGWTQTPNFILDAIPTMRPAEVQVVMAVVRQTLGWRRESISLTVDEMMSLTNLARASVVSGTKEAIEHGYITREADGKSFTYRVASECPQQVESVQKVDSSEEETVHFLNYDEDSSVQKVDSKRPKSVQKVDSKPVQKVNPIKRNIYTNKQKQERGEEARAPTPQPKVVSDGIKATATVKVDSDYLKNCEFVNGYIPPGAGRNAVQVYYERFEIRNNDWRLRKPHEDDLVLVCKDLDLLREVITAYDQANFVKPRNIKLILDWYRHPERFREEHHGNHGASNSGDYQRPPAAQFTQAEWREYAAQKRAELPF